MTMTVTFGNGGSATQTQLVTGTDGYVGDSLALNGGTLTTASPSSGSGVVLPSDPVLVGAVVVPGGGSGSGGTVGVSYDTARNAFAFDVSTAWNSVKNVKAVSTSAEKIVLTDFVHADVYFAGSGDSTVIINDVKRGNVDTGSGNDTIRVSLATNDGGWVNSFSVDSGAGNDTIVFTAGSVSDGAKTTDGRFTRLTIDAGAGNDTLDFSGLNLLEARITGGAGNDTMTGSMGSDIYVYAGAGNGFDTITNFDVTKDKFDLADGVTATTISVGGSTIVSFDGTLVLLQGVTLSAGDSIFI